jgi:hypothetical protein
MRVLSEGATNQRENLLDYRITVPEFLFLDANFGLLGAALCYWAKPISRALNSWIARIYESFPKLKALPGSENAGTDLNYKLSYICFRVCGTCVFVSAAYFSLVVLHVLHE